MPTLIALILISFGPLSLSISCVGIFYPSVAGHLGVEIGTLSYFTSIFSIASFVSLPFLGRIFSRVNARITVNAAIALLAADFVWLSQVNELWQFFAGAVVIGFCISVLLYLAPSTLINRWFAKRAGTALGITMAFTGIGGVVWSSVGGWVIESFGWSAAYLTFAGITVLVLAASLFLIADSPESKGQMPWGFEQTTSCNSGAVTDSPAAAYPRAAADPRAGADPRAAADSHAATSFPTEGTPATEAFRSKPFFLLFALCFALNFCMYAYFMIPSYISSTGLGAAMPLLGATAASVAMGGQTASKIVLGAIGDRAPYAGTAGAVAFGVAGITLLAIGHESAALVYLAALAYGLYYGVATVMMPILTRRAFGLRDYPEIYSRVSMAATLAGSISAFAWGTIIAATGSYTPMFIGVACVLLLAIAATLTIRAYCERGRT